MSNEIELRNERVDSETTELQNVWHAAAQDAYAQGPLSSGVGRKALAVDDHVLVVQPIFDLSGNVIPEGPSRPSESAMRDRAVNDLFFRPQSFDRTSNNLTAAALSSVSEYFNRPVSSFSLLHLFREDFRPGHTELESRAEDLLLRYARTSNPRGSYQTTNENGVISVQQWDDQRREYRNIGLGFRINSESNSIDIVDPDNHRRVVGTVRTRR